MLRDVRFALPEAERGEEEVIRFLDGLAVSMADRVSTQLGDEFVVRRAEPTWDFGSYWAQQVHVRQNERLHATLTLEWSPAVSPNEVRVHCTEARPKAVLFHALVIGSALAGMGAGFSVSRDAGLAGLLLGCGVGIVLHLAGTKLARIFSVGFGRELNAQLAQAIAAATAGLQLESAGRVPIPATSAAHPIALFRERLQSFG